MDESEKRRLKNLGKALVEKRSTELQDQLAATNPAPFGSDEYLRNEILIREKERTVRSSDQVHSGESIRREFIVRPVEFDLREFYPGTYDRFWECRACGNILPTLTTKRLVCSCGNVCLNGGPGAFNVRDEGALRLVQLLGKVAGQAV